MLSTHTGVSVIFYFVQFYCTLSHVLIELETLVILLLREKMPNLLWRWFVRFFYESYKSLGKHLKLLFFNHCEINNIPLF